MKHTPIVALSLLTLISRAFAKCYCGYSVNKTNSDHFGLFTHVTETDFFHVRDVNPTDIQRTGWTAEIYNRTAKESGREVGFSKQLGNVIANALPEGKWEDPPATVGDAGLQLWVRHGIEDGLIPIAEIVNKVVSGKSSGMLYGSYRAAIKFSGMNGTRGAFRWESKHGSRQQGIAIEFSSQETFTLVLSAYTKGEVDTDDTNFAETFTTVLELPREFHEYRFDWLPDRVEFFFDGMLMLTNNQSIPDAVGTLALGHFEDDGLSDPPAQDAVMTVGYVKAYYNTTTRDEPQPGCRNLADNVCVVPDQTKPPNPDEGRTHFYSLPPQSDEEREDEEVKIGATGYDMAHQGGSASTVGAGLLFASFMLVAAYGLL